MAQKPDIDPSSDLVFFDEIQECDAAVASLKCFGDRMPELHLISAGSLLGAKLAPSAFPVGKVERLILFPMSFEEFLFASGDETAKRIFNERSRLESAHTVLWEHCKNYFFTGGLPICVEKWFSDTPIVARIAEIRGIQRTLVKDYESDFVKHSVRINALHIIQVLHSVPRQLASVRDDSVKRYRFRDVVPGKRSHSQLSGPISWLENAGLVYKVYHIEGTPSIPLNAFGKENLFKLFLFDSM